MLLWQAAIVYIPLRQVTFEMEAKVQKGIMATFVAFTYYLTYLRWYEETDMIPLVYSKVLKFG